MTENQERAKEYLDQYRKVRSDLEYFETRVETARTHAEGVKSANHVPTGWRWEIRKETIRKAKRRNVKQERVRVAYPLEGHATHDPHAIEERFCQLEEETRRYECVKAAVDVIRKEIEKRIEAYCDDVNQQQVLRYRYLLFMSFRDIAARSPFSRQHVYKIHDRALEAFGQNMRQKATKCDSRRQ